MELPVWTENDHYFREKARRMTPVARLRLMAQWAGITAVYLSLDDVQRREKLIEIRHAQDRRILGWGDDCPEVPHT